MTHTDVRIPDEQRFDAGYMRRSAATKKNPGNDSREAQEAACKRLGGDDVVMYVDWGLSGAGDKTAKREAYLRLKADIASGHVRSVSAYGMTRLGRHSRELIAFAELCRDHDTTIRTLTDNTDTSTAMGRAMLQLGAVFSELELETGKERSAAGRQARVARQEAAGVPMLGSLAVYGTRHVKGHDDVWRVEPDPERPIEPILKAYKEAGSVRGACELLQRRGVPAPKGGKVWGVSTLARILAKHDPDLMPKPNAAGHRRPTKPRAAFAGVVRCWCGRTMTPSTTRGALYCAGGRDSGASQHGKYFVKEGALWTMLQDAVDDYMPDAPMPDEGALGAELEKLEARRAGLNVRAEEGEIDPDEYRAKLRQIKAEIADAQDRRQPHGLLYFPPYIDRTLPPDEVNGMLRRVWRRVDLDQGYTTAVVTWAGPWHGALQAEAEAEALVGVSDAEMLDAEALALQEMAS